MGGKQKRAAKYKKWIEAQNLLKGASPGIVTSGGENFHDGSGDFVEYQPIPYAVQQEVLKRRAKKSKKHRNSHWLLRKTQSDGRAENVSRSFNQWPSWTCAVLVGLVLSVLIFILIRNLIQMFVAPSSIGRSGLYSGLRMALPRPLFKFIRIIDYLFTSPTLSFQGMSRILYPPEEYSVVN